jgi:hypothetical protein
MGSISAQFVPFLIPLPFDNRLKRRLESTHQVGRKHKKKSLDISYPQD